MVRNFGTKLTPSIINDMDWCKLKVFLRGDRRENGYAPVYFSITINSQRSRFALGVMVPVDKWDHQSCTLIGRNKEVQDLNALIMSEFSRAQNILVSMQINESPKTLYEFQSRFSSKTEKVDFIKFMEEEAEIRYFENEISEGTLKQCKVVVKKLRNYTRNRLVTFEDITPEFLTKYGRHALKEIYTKKGKDNCPTAINTVNNSFKRISTYIKIAIRKGLTKEDPFKRFRIHQVETQRSFLSKDELMILLKLYRDNTLRSNPTLNGVLKNFLLMCATGMRISDLKNFNRSMISEDYITYIPYKTRSKNKMAKIPLNKISREIIDQSEGYNLAYKISDQKMNENLKQIATYAGIHKNISNHIARHTFGTIFLQNGGKVEVLKELLAHSNIHTTMKYAHIVETEKKKQVEQAFDL
jgi:site-specific recombinase XerD